MIGALLVVALSAMQNAAMGSVAARTPSLDLDPCVDVDLPAVQDLVDLELRGRGRTGSAVPTSVAVRCVDDHQEIRLLPAESFGDQGVRTVRLPLAFDADPRAREARSRELALAIAELIRRVETSKAPQLQSPPPRPAATFPLARSVAPAEGGRLRLQLGAQASFDHFGRGKNLAGGDAFLTAHFAGWMLAELSVGGRLASSELLPSGRLTTCAATAAAAAGIELWPNRWSLGAALLFRAQAYLVEFHADVPGSPAGHAANLAAFVISAEPRIHLAVTRSVSLTVGAAFGIPLRGIVVRVQGIESPSMSSFVQSGHLGATVTF